MHGNPILTSGNASLAVTNLSYASGQSVRTLMGFPLGTADGTATGEVAGKVVVVGTTGGSGSTAATGVQATKAVAATGTPEALAATSTLVDSVLLEGKKSRTTNNTGIVYLGFTNVNDAQLLAIAPGGQLTLSAPAGKKIDLSLIFVDVATAADGITYTGFA